MLMIKVLRSLFIGLMALFQVSIALADVQVEGVNFEDSIVYAGVKLQRNGVAVRKRAYFKTEAMALYTQERVKTSAEVYQTNAVRLLRLVVLRDVPSATITRYFLNDFKQSSTDAEFKQVIQSVGIVGGVYGSFTKISKGDVVDITWVPKRGMMAYINKKEVLPKYDTNELFYQIYMRMWVGAVVPEDVRQGLLGLTPS